MYDPEETRDESMKSLLTKYESINHPLQLAATNKSRRIHPDSGGLCLKNRGGMNENEKNLKTRSSFCISSLRLIVSELNISHCQAQMK